jgi:hypothetical protein
MRHFSKINEVPPSATSRTFPSPLDQGLCYSQERETGESKRILTLFECICCRTATGSTPTSIGKVAQSVKQKRLKSMSRRKRRSASCETMNRTVVPNRETKASACLGRQRNDRSRYASKTTIQLSATGLRGKMEAGRTSWSSLLITGNSRSRRSGQSRCSALHLWQLFSWHSELWTVAKPVGPHM